MELESYVGLFYIHNSKCSTISHQSGKPDQSLWTALAQRLAFIIPAGLPRRGGSSAGGLRVDTNAINIGTASPPVSTNPSDNKMHALYLPFLCIRQPENKKCLHLHAIISDGEKEFMILPGPEQRKGVLVFATYFHGSRRKIIKGI